MNTLYQINVLEKTLPGIVIGEVSIIIIKRSDKKKYSLILLFDISTSFSIVLKFP